MLSYSISIIFLFFVSMCLIGLGSILQKTRTDWGSPSSFECGFSYKGVLHTSFSLQMFTLMMVFVCFDLEVVFLCVVGYKCFSALFSGFLLFILVTLWFEWWFGSLVWKL